MNRKLESLFVGTAGNCWNNRKKVVMPTAYCMKCQQMREIKDPKQITLKNGRPATQGTCPVCGTKVFRIGNL